MNSKITFEELWNKIGCLRQPGKAGEREIAWILQRTLGLAKSSEGGIEIFLPGPKLSPRTATVRRHIEHARWEIASSGERIDASRLVFPPQDHFIAISALISVEFIRQGLGELPLQDVMNAVEPIIELALRRGALEEDQIIGLIGELLCLECLLDSISSRPELRMAVLDMWQGYQRGARDFRIGRTSIEVKTTRHESSAHRITGLHQISLGPESHESSLLLFSVGLAASESDGQSLPEITQRISEKLCDPSLGDAQLAPLQLRFIANVATYGVEHPCGYDHHTMAKQKVYSSRFRATFSPRLYDLCDPEIRIIRPADLVDTYVDSTKIRYQMNLPDIVSGTNPVASWRHTLTNILLDYFVAE